MQLTILKKCSRVGGLTLEHSKHEGIGQVFGCLLIKYFKEPKVSIYHPSQYGITEIWVISPYIISLWRITLACIS